MKPGEIRGTEPKPEELLPKYNRQYRDKQTKWRPIHLKAEGKLEKAVAEF